MTVTLLLRTRSETRSDRDTRSCVRQTYTHTRTHRLMQAMARCSLAHSTTRTRSVLQRETDAVVARSIDLSTRPPSPDLVLILYRLSRRFIFWSSPHYLSHLSFALTLVFLACGMDLRQRTLRESESAWRCGSRRASRQIQTRKNRGDPSSTTVTNTAMVPEPFPLPRDREAARVRAR